MDIMNNERCIYKFTQKDKFDGKPYCAFFNEKCQNLDFICEINCKVYEYEEENKKLKEKILLLEQESMRKSEHWCSMNKMLSKYEKTLKKIKEIATQEDKRQVIMSGGHRNMAIIDILVECEILKENLTQI